MGASLIWWSISVKHIMENHLKSGKRKRGQRSGLVCPITVSDYSGAFGFTMMQELNPFSRTTHLNSEFWPSPGPVVCDRNPALFLMLYVPWFLLKLSMVLWLQGLSIVNPFPIMVFSTHRFIFKSDIIICIIPKALAFGAMPWDHRKREKFLLWLLSVISAPGKGRPEGSVEAILWSNRRPCLRQTRAG